MLHAVDRRAALNGTAARGDDVGTLRRGRAGEAAAALLGRRVRGKAVLEVAS